MQPGSIKKSFILILAGTTVGLILAASPKAQAQGGYFGQYFGGQRPPPPTQRRPARRHSSGPSHDPYDPNYEPDPYGPPPPEEGRPPFPDDPEGPYDPGYGPGPDGRPYDPEHISDDEDKPGTKNPALTEFYQQPIAHMPFVVKNPEWTPAMEDAFGKFVTQMGRAVRAGKCNNVKSCFKNAAANMYANQDSRSLIMYSDCGKFPHLLRTYFAYHNQLPMSVSAHMSINKHPYASVDDRQQDLQVARLDNSPYGNVFGGRAAPNVVGKPGQEFDLVHYLMRVIDDVSTRNFRVGPMTPGYDNGDLYPVKIDHDGIRPGTVVHTTGHVYIVYEVDVKGEIHLLDAHPDGSMTGKKIISSSTLERSRPDQGLGFYRFRSLRLEGAHAVNGAYYGGHIVDPTVKELTDKGVFSLEQYFGPGSTVLPGTAVSPDAWHQSFKQVDFFTYVEMQMRQENLVVNADDEVGDLLGALCDEMQQRVDDVNQALNSENRLTEQVHPDSIPANIYTSDDQNWEAYASPGRDARMKASTINVIKTAVLKFRQAKAGGFKVRFAGSAADYQKSVLQKLSAMDQKCRVKYKNSEDRTVTLTFNDVIERLSRLSFDPYDCAEKRWGASDSELMSCRDQDYKNRWYDAEQVIRNTIGKSTPSERLIIRSQRPITVDMLEDSSNLDRPETSEVNLGTRKAPYLSLKGAFSSNQFLQALQETSTQVAGPQD